MARLDIKVYPDAVLRKKAKAIDKVSDNDRKLAYDLIETMRYAGGIGIAAPQVGISKRIIVIGNVGGKDKSSLVLINPRILKRQGKGYLCEGCLSVPWVTSDIIRPESIIVEALNLDGEVLKIETGGLLARVIQHEADHLDGVLFIDRVGFLKRKKILKQISTKVCVRL